MKGLDIGNKRLQHNVVDLFPGSPTDPVNGRARTHTHAHTHTHARTHTHTHTRGFHR